MQPAAAAAVRRGPPSRDVLGGRGPGCPGDALRTWECRHGDVPAGGRILGGARGCTYRWVVCYQSDAAWSFGYHLVGQVNRLSLLFLLRFLLFRAVAFFVN